MKIAILLGLPNPSPGAGWARIGFLAEAWSKKGHEVEVLGIFTYTTVGKRGAAKLGGVTVSNLMFGIMSDHPIAFLVNSVSSVVASIPYLLARRPDVVVVSVPSGPAGVGMLMACRLSHAKYVVDYRDEWEAYSKSLSGSRVGKYFYSMVEKIAASLYRKGLLTAAVTENFEETLRQRGLKNVVVMTNGADVTVFKPSSQSKKGGLTLFYSGSVGGYYRLDVVLKALKLLSSTPAVTLVIAGKGEISRTLETASELGVAERVKYAGAIEDRSTLSDLMGSSDVGLIPYDDNPLWKNAVPAKFFEYCACGLPVLATAREDSLLSKLIRQHEIGITSPPMDEAGLAGAVRKLYEDAAFRESAGRRARSLVETEFDRSKIAEQFLTLVTDRIGQSSKKRPAVEIQNHKYAGQGVGVS